MKCGATKMKKYLDKEGLQHYTDIIKDKLDNIVDQKYLSGNENVEITRGFEDDNYVQLDWLQSDGTCVIDLGIIPDATSQFDLKYQNERLSHSSPINTYLYGCISSQLSSSGKGWALGISGSSITTYTDLYFPSAETYTTRQSFVGADTYWHTVSVLPYMVIYDGANIFSHTTWSSATGGRSIALFGVFTGSSSDPTEWAIAPSFGGKIAYFKEYKTINNVKTLTHDFIPVRRKSDNVLGFYDKVTEAFCTNIGSGTFVGGPVYEIKVSANPSGNTFQLVASNSLQDNTFDRFTAPASAFNTLYNTTYGKGTTVTGNYNVAIGTNAGTRSTAGGAIAVGYNTNAAGDHAVCVGTENVASGTNAIAIGYHTKASGNYSVNIGNGQLRDINNYSVSIGYNNRPSHSYSVYIGSDITSAGDNSIAIGHASYAATSVAIGDRASAGVNSVAIGNNAKTDMKAVDIGCKTGQTTEYQTGEGTVAIGQDTKPYNSKYNVIIGKEASVTDSSATNSIVIGESTIASSGSAVGIGINYSSRPVTLESVAIGYGANAAGNRSISIGTDSQVSNATDYQMSFGYGAYTKGQSSISIGHDAKVSSANGSLIPESIAIGHLSSVSAGAGSSIAIGCGAISAGSYANTVIGFNANATTGNFSIALGSHAKVGADYAIQLGDGTNNEFNTLKFRTYKLVGSDGIIPYARLTTDAPTDGYALKYDENEDALVWGPASANIPVATASRLGGIKVGSGLSITNDGTLSADVQSNNFEDIGGDPYDNQPLSDALTGLQDNIDNVESDLQSQIDALSSIGQFLAIWDCDTGIARYLDNGYQYQAGNYFIIGSVAENVNIRAEVGHGAAGRTVTVDPDYIGGWINYFGNTEQVVTFTMGAGKYGLDFSTNFDSKVWTKAELENDLGITTTNFNTMGDVFTVTAFLENYMPDGSSYPGAVITTEDVKISDMWFYDGTHWIYLANHERAVAVDSDLSTTSTNPVENKTITLALEDKQDTLEAGKGITINGNVISASSDSVGVPQIANVYADQLNSPEKALAREPKYTHLGFYSDICFNLNLTKEQILDKADELYIGLERFKRNMVTSHTFDPESGEEEGKEISYRNIPAFKLQNDHFVHTDRKMYCYRYNYGGYEDPEDDRNYTYFYSNFEYASYQDMFDGNEGIYAFYGEYTFGNRASCLNTLRYVGSFQDYEDGDENWERYPDGDIEVFVNVNKDDSIANGYITLRVCRQYIVDGQKKYYWSNDWEDSGVEIYATSTRKIPTEYTGSLESVGLVEDLDGYEYVKRPDLNYWTFNFDNYNLSDWFEDILEPNTLQGAAWGEESLNISWRCYWLDYPLQPVLLQDCDVRRDDGSWVKLKDIIEDGAEDNLPERVIFRFPYNSAEIWLRFSAWQKRCMYNEYNDEQDIHLDLGQKKALVYAWDWNAGQLVTDKRAFARQRNMYSFNGDNTKICEYVQFNLYDPECVYAGTKSKSTPFKKRVVINKANGSTSIRD